MKKIGLLTGALLLIGLSQQACAQKKTERKEITKEVKVTEDNGEKVVTVVSSEDGKSKTETYKGAEADKKLKELDGSDAPMDAPKMENGRNINMNEINGVKTLTITTVENGKSKTETFTGADAEKKMAEIEKAGPPQGKAGTQEIRIKKTIDTKTEDHK